MFWLYILRTGGGKIKWLSLPTLMELDVVIVRLIAAIRAHEYKSKEISTPSPYKSEEPPSILQT
jgi:hypothetical protein